jgi:hypothetical protein
MKNITLTEEKFNSEWVTFWGNMCAIGLNENFNEDDLKNDLKTAAGALSVDTGLAYPGALLVHINLMTNIAQRLAKMVCGTFPNIDNQTLVKVCCLQHLSKIVMYEENDNQWEIEKRGMVYKFAETEGCLKFGERSALMAMNAGVKLTPSEFEAICSLDKDGEEAKARKYMVGILSTIVRQANELAYAIEKEKFNKLNENE